MRYNEATPFYRLLATKYDRSRESEAIEILTEYPELAILEWPGPDDQGRPFVKGSTALHYAANDGKLELVTKLVKLGADVNANRANWFRSALSWAANNARLEAIRLLLDKGADPASLDALNAAAWGGSSSGADEKKDYAAALELLIGAGADMNDRRHFENRTLLGVALSSGNDQAIRFLRSLGAVEQ